MKRALLLFAAMLVLRSSPAPAATEGINLGWRGMAPGSECPSAGVAFECDPCDNTGNHVLVGSVVAPAGLTRVTGEEIYIDVGFDDPTLPDFWHLEQGGCRSGALNMVASFAGFSTAVCNDYWKSSAEGGFNWRENPGVGPFSCDGVSHPGPSPGHGGAFLQAVFARTQTSATAMTAGTEYYVFQATIDGLHAAADPADPGATVCPGCRIQGCFVVNEIILTQPVGVGDAVLTYPSTRNWVSWQDPLQCGSVPAQRPTWGKIKSLYR